MKRFTAFFILSSFIALPAQAINLNQTSTLADEGVDPSPEPLFILDNIPLMQGLQLTTDVDLVKILPDPRTPQPVIAVGVLDVDDIYNFYKRELPPLGWTATSGRDYVRGDETLHIDAHADGKQSTVTFAQTR